MSRSLIYLARYSPLFYFNDPSTTEIYTLSLHDALPISFIFCHFIFFHFPYYFGLFFPFFLFTLLIISLRSEEHTSELQSRPHLVCRLLLEKKKSNLHTFSCLSSSLARRLSNSPEIYLSV